ncbi:homeobox-leucine zipper protein ATHB-15-like [Helianthus annuus]|uniref:homeobox-leucine zipper protein ATHB-15-like n=1 Tax=Helianthus annuus TaxID=4232 RepID=UPI000B8F79C9|nr:homeobox-leucine zipper protein ATHB-15-like [Helianthus annuus]
MLIVFVLFFFYVHTKYNQHVLSVMAVDERTPWLSVLKCKYECAQFGSAINNCNRSHRSNGCFRQHTQNTTVASKDTSCESVVSSGQGQRQLTPQHPPRDASPAGLLSIAEETLTDFLWKATGTAVEWVQMPGMKPSPDSIGIVAISHSCTGVASRACGLVSLEPTRVSKI